MQGTDSETADVLARGELPANLDPRERALLTWVGLLTERPWTHRPEDVETLRAAGWSDPEIAEACYVAGLFAWMNRVADAFGLEDPGYDRLASGRPSGFRPATQYAPQAGEAPDRNPDEST